MVKDTAKQEVALGGDTAEYIPDEALAASMDELSSLIDGLQQKYRAIRAENEGYTSAISGLEGELEVARGRVRVLEVELPTKLEQLVRDSRSAYRLLAGRMGLKNDIAPEELYLHWEKLQNDFNSLRFDYTAVKQRLGFSGDASYTDVIERIGLLQRDAAYEKKKYAPGFAGRMRRHALAAVFLGGIATTAAAGVLAWVGIEYSHYAFSSKQDSQQSPERSSLQTTPQHEKDNTATGDRNAPKGLGQHAVPRETGNAETKESTETKNNTEIKKPDAGPAPAPSPPLPGTSSASAQGTAITKAPLITVRKAGRDLIPIYLCGKSRHLKEGFTPPENWDLYKCRTQPGTDAPESVSCLDAGSYVGTPRIDEENSIRYSGCPGEKRCCYVKVKTEAPAAPATGQQESISRRSKDGGA